MMRIALEQARLAGDQGDVPVGALLVLDGNIVVSTHNAMKASGDATAHAELHALKLGADAIGADRLRACTLYVTLEPCAMCAGAIVLARIARLVFGAWDDKAGMCGSVGDIVRHPRLNHRPEVRGGVLAGESAELLRSFFQARR